MNYEDKEQEFINSLIREINKWSLGNGLVASGTPGACVPHNRRP